MRIYTMLVLLLVACGGEEVSEPVGPSAETCGVIACVDENEGFEPAALPADGFGKADADSVEAALGQVVADGILDADDVRALFEAAGSRVNEREMAIIRGALEATAFEVLPEAAAALRFMARTHGLSEAEVSYAEAGLSYAGTALPEAVVELLVRARLKGAIAYDVNEQNAEGEGIWSPYPATTPATENMDFAYTEITPEALAADLADTTVEYNAIVGTEEAELPDGRTYRRARYEARVGGTGNISAHYDEVYHPDIYARGRSGQRWSSNFAILSDGSLHCLPAARRSVAQDLILTNPHLSRGARLLYNGHLTVRAGVVTSVEMSGRLSKRAARGKSVFVDPIAMLEAWGLEIAPDVSLRYGNTSDGTPVRDLEAGVVRAADTQE